MSGLAEAATFSASWLQQREPFDRSARDAAARSLRLPARLASLRPTGDEPWRVIDLACGTGANLRWLAPRLTGPQQWLVVDHDPQLLRCWPARLGLPDDPPGSLPPLDWVGPGCRTNIVRQPLDLMAGLESLPWQAAHLVSASALLDLVGADWLQRLVDACVASRVALLMSLSVDGRDAWEPRDSMDHTISKHFAEHQQRDKGFGPALGAAAVPMLRRALRAAGYRVFEARSDWFVDGSADLGAETLLRSMIDGMAAAAQEQEPARTSAIQAWRERRQAVARETRLRVGHTDLLALPP